MMRPPHTLWLIPQPICELMLLIRLELALHRPTRSRSHPRPLRPSSMIVREDRVTLAAVVTINICGQARAGRVRTLPPAPEPDTKALPLWPSEAQLEALRGRVTRQLEPIKQTNCCSRTFKFARQVTPFRSASKVEIQYSRLPYDACDRDLEYRKAECLVRGGATSHPALASVAPPLPSRA